MDQNLIFPFMKMTTQTFETMLNMQVEIGSPTVKTESTASFDVSAIIGLSGDVEGAVVLSLPMATAQRIVSIFTGQETVDEGEELCDAIGELLNMIAGGSKAMMEGRKVSISCPSVVVGAGHTVHGQKDRVCVCIPCSCDCGEFNVEVAMKGTAGASLSGNAGASAAA